MDWIFTILLVVSLVTFVGHGGVPEIAYNFTFAEFGRFLVCLDLHAYLCHPYTIALVEVLIGMLLVSL